MHKIKIGLTVKIFMILIMAFTVVFIYSIHIDLNRYRIDYISGNQENNFNKVLEYYDSNNSISLNEINTIISETTNSDYGYYYVLNNQKEIQLTINCYDYLKIPQYAITGRAIEQDMNIVVDLSSLTLEQTILLKNVLDPYNYDIKMEVSGDISELNDNNQMTTNDYLIKPTYLKVRDKVIFGNPNQVVYNAKVSDCNTTNFCVEGRDFCLHMIRDFNQEQLDINNGIISQIDLYNLTSHNNKLTPLLDEISYSVGGFNQKENWYGYSLANISYLDEHGEVNYGYLLYVQYYRDFNDISFKRYLLNNQPTYLVSLLVVIFVSSITSIMITRRIKKIDKIAKRFSNNDFDQKIIIKGNDELTSLSTHLNTMADNLKMNIDSLNNEIEQVKNLESLRKEFIANFTHEIKTPLAIINGNIELLEESNNANDKYIGIINNQLRIINNLIYQMLDLSKLEANAVILTYQEFELEDLVVDIIDNSNNLLLNKGLKIDLISTNPIIYADYQRISMVIQNFVSNAIKHSDNNSMIKVNISNECFSICNKGKQIKEEMIEKIWFSFVSNDATGTGLGLAICKNILELHNFNYGVKNIDDGVMFYFKFDGRNADG